MCNHRAVAVARVICGGGGGGGGSAQSNIGIVKTVDNADPATGATINYTLTVSATGPRNRSGVVANDVLPAGVTFDSASSSVGSYASSTGIWTIGDVADGNQATLVITATVTAPDGTIHHEHRHRFRITNGHRSAFGE